VLHGFGSWTKNVLVLRRCRFIVWGTILPVNKLGNTAPVAKLVKRRSVEWVKGVLQCKNHHYLVSVTAL